MSDSGTPSQATSMVPAGSPVQHELPVGQARQKRMRSVDTLQRLYTTLMALALLPSISQLISTAPSAPAQPTASIDFHIQVLPTFIAMIVTFVPLYHAATRYLDEAYIFGDKALASNRLDKVAVLTDYALFLLHALAFYALAITVAAQQVFFAGLAFVFALDCAWVVTGKRHAHTADSRLYTRWWLVLNIPAALLMLVLALTPLPAAIEVRWLAAVALCLRTAVDYWKCWSFYWPGTDTPAGGWAREPAQTASPA